MKNAYIVVGVLLCLILAGCTKNTNITIEYPEPSAQVNELEEVIDELTEATEVKETEEVNDLEVVTSIIEKDMVDDLETKFHTITTGDQKYTITLKDTYDYSEKNKQIMIKNRLSSSDLEILQKMIEEGYKEEVAQQLSEVYKHVYEKEGKRIKGMIPEVLEITVLSMSDVEVNWVE